MNHKQIYETPTSDVVDLKMNGFLCQSSLGMDGASGNRKLEDRDYNGNWGGNDVWY